MHQPVAEELAIDIIEGRWPQGEALTIEDIQQRFSVSRTVAREAARQLQSTGAVSMRRRTGLTAEPVNHWSALDQHVIRWKLHSNHRREQLISLTELRLAIEPAAAGGAARHAPIDVRATLPVLAREMRRFAETGSLEDFHTLDIQFHSLLLQNSGNELFAAFSDTVATIIRGRVEIGMYPDRPRMEALDAHEAVAEGVWKADVNLAVSNMRFIVDEVGAAVSEQTGNS